MTIWDHATRFLFALLIWREARGESHDCQVAVAWCVWNRVQRPSWWGRTLYQVITKKWQFSSLTDPNDPQLATWPAENDPVFSKCAEIAGMVMDGVVNHPFPGADSYYDISIPAPKWATTEKYRGRIGRIIFFDLDSDYEKVITVT